MAKKAATQEITVEDKLKALYELQRIDSAIDNIKTLRGELPLEVQDLEDEIAGLETRIEKVNTEIAELDQQIAERKNTISGAKELIKKYEQQQMNVRNNREYDSLTKEIEFQNLEIELADKRIKESKAAIAAKNEIIDAAKERVSERTKDLDHKKGELEAIIDETRKDEEDLMKKSVKAEEVIEDRLLGAYKRLRGNARNGLAVVAVEREACGGCFSSVPPQRQLDIRSHKKVIVCENCGRILVDASLGE